MKNLYCSLLLMLTLMLPATVMARTPDYDNYEFIVDDIFYKIVNDTAVVTFQGFYSSSFFGGYGGDVIIPTTVTHEGKTYPVAMIDDNTFIRCYNLTSITIPESIIKIGHDAFYNCIGLTRVNITDLEAWFKINMESNPLVYAQHLYLNGTKVTEIIIPEFITRIRNFAFEGCIDLTSVTIPNTVTSIGHYAFRNCTGLTSIVIPNSVTDIGMMVFEGCTGLTSVTLGNSVTAINSYAFSHCAGLTSIEIPETVTTIGANVFMGCTGLTSIVIPDLVTEIGNGAFGNCTGLTSLTIGKSVTSIGTNAFNNTSLIETVTCKATTPPSWGNMDMFTTNVFNHAPLHVPVGCERAYKADTNWGQFSTIIGDIDNDNPLEYLKCDVNGDGEVNIADVNKVIDTILKY
ncbi:MAG: leucine-rich repeat domain-containing protein [Muribaculaceae bacterium]|nr:leucine-rich repeat domain-containing protein [Muribaculaceae bacterium]